MIRILSLLFTLPLFLTAQPVINVKNFGATGIKTELATTAIQTAIDYAAAQGGGQVYLPPGEYLCGTIVMKDNITLWVEAGATIFGSRVEEDYSPDHRDLFGNPVLLYAKGVKRITLRGKGVIDGQAVREYRDLEKVDKFIGRETELARESGVEMKMYYKVKPITALLYFTECEDITIEDLSFVESNFWTVHIERCQRVFLRGLYVYSDLETGVNADGIDISESRDVTISDCIVITGDDGICLKSKDPNNPVENITVTNCVVSSSSTALKIGTETHGDFRHIIFSNCVVRNSNRGLSIVVRDGATVSDVLFTDITVECRRRHFNWWGDGDPIWLVILKRRETSRTGKIENVRFNNILATGVGTSRIESRVGRNINGVSLNNVSIHMRAEHTPDKRATHALEAIDVDNLTINNLQISWATDSIQPKWKHALYLDSVFGFQLKGFEGRQGLLEQHEAVIHLHQVKDALISEAEGTEGANTLVHVSGAESEEILLERFNRRKKAKVSLSKAAEVGKRQLKLLR